MIKSTTSVEFLMEKSRLVPEHLSWYKEFVCYWYYLPLTNLYPPCEPRANDGLLLEDFLDLRIRNLDDVVLLEFLSDSFRSCSTSSQYLKATLAVECWRMIGYTIPVTLIFQNLIERVADHLRVGVVHRVVNTIADITEYRASM
jgi:hypothetical protein